LAATTTATATATTAATTNYSNFNLLLQTLLLLLLLLLLQQDVARVTTLRATLMSCATPAEIAALAGRMALACGEPNRVQYPWWSSLTEAALLVGTAVHGCAKVDMQGALGDTLLTTALQPGAPVSPRYAHYNTSTHTTTHSTAQ
jgi:hypothetical protein